MCDKCADIDYPVADPIWLPCGGPQDRYTSRHRRPAYSEPDKTEASAILTRLTQQIRALKAENAALKAAQSTPHDQTFTGIE